MLKKNRKKNTATAAQRFAIVASRYNDEYVDSMLNAAADTLRKAGASEVQVIRVPGAYEIPVAAAKLASLSAQQRQKSRKLGAIICLGVILRGETTHAAHIGEAVTNALMSIQTEWEIPVVHEVLLLENRDQAKKRCLDPEYNRGVEAAGTALEMASVMASF